MNSRTAALTFSCILAATGFAQDPSSTSQDQAAEEFQIQSTCLGAFWGREMTVEAGVVLPPDFERGEELPICYSIHGFGGSHRSAWRSGPGLVQGMRDGTSPRMLYVFLNAQFPMGHHEFADSVNNGPWGKALITEFIPALEAKYAPKATSSDRFLTGHSSGGWSSLWLQVTYPTFFNGTWSTAPDSVDFRDFTGIDVYSWDNAYVDPEGEVIQLMRRADQWVRSIREFAQGERERNPLGGQFYSFNAVFSPRGEDGTPVDLFDWETGAINPEVRERWRTYDISLTLRTRWQELEKSLAGKIHLYMGTLDTFRLEGATMLMKRELEEIGADVDILLVEGRDHGSLFAPHPQYWPDGMLAQIHRAMRTRWEAGR